MAPLRRRNAEDYCEEALRRYRARDYAGALALADKAIGLAPQHAMAHHLRGGALSDLGRHAEALVAFCQAIALDPAMTYVQYQIALQLNLLGLNAEALEAVDAAMSMMPDDTAPVVLRGAILFSLRRYDDALAAFTGYLERKPDTAPVLVDRAQALRALGRYDEALAYYDRALALAPGLPRTSEEKGITLVMVGRYDHALEQFHESTATAQVWAAAIHWHRQEPRQARRLFESAAGQPMGMNRYESVTLRAVVACALGRTDSAADLLRAEAGPGDPASQDVLRRLYDLLGDPPMPGIDQLRAITFGS